MIYRSLVRALLTSAALAAGVLLSGCNSDDVSLANNAKANQPVPPKLLAAMSEKDMDLQSPVLVRLFKQEAELEVWKQNRSGQFALLKSYPICRWSGDLGPKVREGDRQAPEGFYTISPGQMNPQSAYYLSFNTGYPNAFDKALGRTGSQLMVHGDCSSRGCYAMTDEQIAEIYSLGARILFRRPEGVPVAGLSVPDDADEHGQAPQQSEHAVLEDDQGRLRSFRGDEARAEGRFLREEIRVRCRQGAECDARPGVRRLRQMPGLCDPRRDRRRRAREAAAGGGRDHQADRQGHPGGADQYRHRRRHEQDFRRQAPEGNTGLSEGGDSQSLSTLALARAPGTIPSTVNPPKPNLAQPEEPSGGCGDRLVAHRRTDPRRLGGTGAQQSEGFFSNLARKVGIGGSADATPASAPPRRRRKAQVADAKPQPIGGPRCAEARSQAGRKPGRPRPNRR